MRSWELKGELFCYGNPTVCLTLTHADSSHSRCSSQNLLRQLPLGSYLHPNINLYILHTVVY